jgi:hypothetical protein
MTEGKGSSQFLAKAAGLFDDPTMAEIAKMLRITNSSALLELQGELISTCAHYREVITTLPCDLPYAPFNLSLTKRAEWLETNVIKPSERLLMAIDDEKRAMFSTWPYPLTVPEFRNNATLKSELDALRDTAIQLLDSLRAQQSDDAGHSQELRAEVFASIARALRKHSEVQPSRGVYVPELRYRVGNYVDAMRLIFHKITGVEENLDRLIRGEIASPS